MISCSRPCSAASISSPLRINTSRLGISCYLNGISPEIRHGAKMLGHPFIRVDRVEVTLATIGKNCDTGRSSPKLILHLIDGCHNCTGRTADEERLRSHQATAADNTRHI